MAREREDQSITTRKEAALYGKTQGEWGMKNTHDDIHVCTELLTYT